MNINTASRTELEIVILEEDIENLFPETMEEFNKLSTEEIRETIINWMMENDDCKF